MAHSLSEVKNGTTTVGVFNPSRDHIELHSGEHLGEFLSASAADIIYHYTIRPARYEENLRCVITLFNIMMTI